MAIKGFTRKCKPLELLSDGEVEAMHVASVDILKETGVKFDTKWACDFLKKNGCKVDEETRVVRFPEGLVEEAIRKTPSTFRAIAREEKYDMVYSRDVVYYQDAPAMHIYDFQTQTTRKPTKQEYSEYVKVLDYLPTIHGLSCYPYFACEGVPPVMVMPELMAIKFKHTSKFHECPYSNDSEIFCIEMAQAVGCEILGAISVSSPLCWSEAAVNQARRFVEAGFPVGPCSGATFGATAPATLAGAVAKTNAELISMLVFVQLLNPGQRALMWELDLPQNMKTGSPDFGQITAAIANAMYNQVWRYYRVPTANATPGFINAKTPDFQSGYERSIGTIISALSGCCLIQLHGCVMGELSGHPAMAVLDDDIAAMVGKVIEGESVDHETLAVDLIKEVGPAPGHFMSKEHTRKWWQKEQFVAKSIDRTPNYKDWYANDKKDAIKFALERTKEILDTHKPNILDENKSAEIDKILEKARKYYKGKGQL